jgi:hypothetical protein
MPFHSDLEVQNRLQKDASSLTQQEIRDMLPWLRTLGEGHIRILWAHLSLLTMQAIDRFNESSTVLTKRLYWLTWALVVLTIVITIFTILLWGRG